MNRCLVWRRTGCPRVWPAWKQEHISLPSWTAAPFSVGRWQECTAGWLAPETNCTDCTERPRSVARLYPAFFRGTWSGTVDVDVCSIPRIKVDLWGQIWHLFTACVDTHSWTGVFQKDIRQDTFYSLFRTSTWGVVLVWQPNKIHKLMIFYGLTHKP